MLVAVLSFPGPRHTRREWGSLILDVLVGACGALLAFLRGVTAGRRALLYLVLGNLIAMIPGLNITYGVTHRTTFGVSLFFNLVMVTGMTMISIATVDHLGGFTLLILAAVRDGNDLWTGLVTGTILMTSGMGIRQMMAINDNQRLATTDTMTGVSNRMSLILGLERSLERAQRTGIPTAVLLFDLNEFKRVNDTLGHNAGDVVLAAFATALVHTDQLEPDHHPQPDTSPDPRQVLLVYSGGP
jgi:predicted signal transduction protein with EAL and GGDEF domain